MNLSNIVRLLKICLAASSSLAILGCSVTSPFWSESKVQGPPRLDGTPTQQIQRCTTTVIEFFPGAGGHCAYAFSSKGAEDLQFWILGKELEQAARGISQLHYMFRDLQSRTASGRIQRYDLYVVAIYPTVVVGVPSPRTDWKLCNYARGCFSLHDSVAAAERWSMPSSSVFYNTRPPVREGAFWFAPKQVSEPIPLDAAADKNTFTIGARRVTLQNQSGEWNAVFD